MSAEEFLNRLEQSGLLSASTIASLRSQISRSPKPIAAEQLAKLLVSKGKLDPAQAQQILTQAPAPQPVAAVPGELALAPLTADDLLTPAQVAPAAPQTGSGNGNGLAPIESAPALTPLDNSGGLSPAPATPAAPQPPPMPAAAPMGTAPSGGPEMLQPISDPMAGDPMGAGAGPMTDPMSADPMAMAGGQAAQPAAAPAGGFRGKVVLKPWANRFFPWICGFLLLFLMMFVAWMVFVLMKGDVQERWKMAEKYYSEQQYAEAAIAYEKFARDFKKDERAEEAKVKRALALLRIPVSSRSWDDALRVAKEELPKVEHLAKFSVARPELAGMLPDIAEGFTANAMKAATVAKKEELVKSVEDAMELVDNSAYIPRKQRTNPTIEARLQKILDDLGIVQHDIRRAHALAAALKEIDSLIEVGNTNEAYKVRKDLIREFQSLRSNDDLESKLTKIANRIMSLVETSDEVMNAVSDDRAPPPGSIVVMANNVGQSVAGASGVRIPILANGSVYGIDAENGRFLWRRFVGYESTFYPQLIQDQQGKDTIAVDVKHHELLRLRLEDGSVVWRLPIGEPFVLPAVSNKMIFLATESGKLLQISPDSGQSVRQAILPEKLNAGTGYDPAKTYIYQPGLRSYMFVFAAGQVEPREVVIIGHADGTIVVPPLILGDHVLVAENAGDDYSILHIFSSDKGLDLKSPQAPIRLAGHVVEPPKIVSRGRAMVVTDLGGIYFFQIQPGANEDDPDKVEEIAEFPATGTKNVHGFPIVSGTQMFIGSQGFTKFDVQYASGKLNRAWRKNSNDTFDGPLHVIGDAVIHTRRRAREPGVSVAAVSQKTGEQIWRTDLGVKRPGPPIFVGDRIVSISSQGNMFNVDSRAVQTENIGKATLRPTATERPILLYHQLQLNNQNALAFVGNPDQAKTESRVFVTYDPAKGAQPLRLVNMKLPKGRATADPTVFQNGLLIPWSNGQVMLLDGDTGQERVERFQPPVRPGVDAQWRRPALIENGDEFVIADNRGRIFRVGITQTPRPHLAQRGNVDVPFRISSDLSVAGKIEGSAGSENSEQRLFAVSSDQGSDIVVSFQLPNLSPGKDLPLTSRLVWGPERIGEIVMLATDDGTLMCFGTGESPVWVGKLVDGPLAGIPVAHDGDFILTSTTGTVYRLDGTSGQQVGESIVVGQPLGSGATITTQNTWVYGNDGALHVLPTISK